jgi:hypothetical protein
LIANIGALRRQLAPAIGIDNESAPHSTRKRDATQGPNGLQA